MELMKIHSNIAMFQNQGHYLNLILLLNTQISHLNYKKYQLNLIISMIIFRGYFRPIKHIL